jgi:hypothetical protein
MEDNMQTKHPLSPYKENSPPPSSVSTPPSEVSLLHHYSPVFEQGGPSERITVVGLSSKEEDVIPDITRGDEFTKKLFGDLNREILGPLGGNGKVIILSDSVEEEEVCEEATAAPAAVASSVVKSPAQLPPPPTLMMHLRGVQNYSNDGCSLIGQ